jgi:chlorite dismutase
MQLHVYRGSEDAAALMAGLEQAKLPGVLYEDLNDPWGVALLTFSETPDFFIGPLRRFLRQPPSVASAQG